MNIRIDSEIRRRIVASLIERCHEQGVENTSDLALYEIEDTIHSVLVDFDHRLPNDEGELADLAVDLAPSYDDLAAVTHTDEFEFKTYLFIVDGEVTEVPARYQGEAWSKANRLIDLPDGFYCWSKVGTNGLVWEASYGAWD